MIYIYICDDTVIFGYVTYVDLDAVCRAGDEYLRRRYTYVLVFSGAPSQSLFNFNVSAIND